MTTSTSAERSNLLSQLAAKDVQLQEAVASGNDAEKRALEERSIRLELEARLASCDAALASLRIEHQNALAKLASIEANFSHVKTQLDEKIALFERLSRSCLGRWLVQRHAKPQPADNRENLSLPAR